MVALKFTAGSGSVGEAGNCLPAPTVCDGGACSWMPVVELEPAPIHALIQVSMVSAQALGSATQQLCPPPTFSTSSDWSGCVKFTSGPTAWYARFTSSERANIGDWPPSWWHAPQRSDCRTFSHRLILKACTSALEAAGPV